MKIALYGMPCAGKSTLMDRITDAKVINGSQELRRICGGSFLELSEEEKHQVRIKYTEYINGLNDEVIVSDGHYSFMETVAFTEADGELYDIFIYLYCSPENLKERYALSEKNGKFAGESIESLRQWQEFEINNLREECHRRNKDFCILRLLRAAVHGKPFRLCQQHVILKYRVGVGLYIFGSSPTGRAVFHTFAVFLRVLAFDIDNQPDKHRAENPYQ